MLNDKELNWMSQNAAEITAARQAADEEIKVYVRKSDNARAVCQGSKCIEISLPVPDRNDPDWDYLPRVGCRVKVLRDNGFERVEE